MAEEIICLGKKFNSENERREYFRNELRKKLPELKKIDGFPLGEDEDIISLSDPPYFTICPNPWLNEIIADCELEKAQLLRDGLRLSDYYVDKPFTADISSGKNNPIYNAHSYHTKVPHPAIMRYILQYTQPGDIVFDGFAGTGMTAVAAQECCNPSLTTKSAFQNEFSILGLNNPKWGIRRSICIDLSPAACFIAYSFNREKNIELFLKQSNDIIKKVKADFGWLYETKHINGGKGRINFTVWSDVFICSNCGEEIIFWDQAVDHEKKQSSDTFLCDKCGAVNSKNISKRLFISEYDHILGSTRKIAKVIPVLINYSFQNKRYEKIPDKDDIKLINELDKYLIGLKVPSNILPDGFNLNQPRKSHGVTHVHHFYTKRNLIVLAALFNEIRIRNNPDLLSWFTSTLTWCGRENRLHLGNYFNKKGGPITSLRGTWYISSLSVETNVVERFVLRTRSAIFLSKNKIENAAISTQSATSLENINSESIDYIFVDPPFGSNLMYSELNIVWESWLRVITNNNDEAIINNVQEKGIFEYQELMESSFRNFYRLLKPGKWMTVEFSNTNASIWNGIQNSINKAGFIIANVSGLDKQKGSFKAVTTTTAVKQDLVISCYKPTAEFEKRFNEVQSPNISVWDFVREHLRHLPIHLAKENTTSTIIERSSKILYDRVITFYLMRGHKIPIDSRDFLDGIKQRFIERDGMFFTHDQVSVYDQKKSANPTITQYSWQVATESEGIEWLKRELNGRNLKYQEIQPKWMQAITAVRKGDVLPELRDLLQQNFIEELDGSWRVPDMNEAKDREIIRNKALLKEFNSYVELANNPKAKRMKEVRVEALRAGFKQCWDTKDFPTIVKISDKIPQNLLLEDEQLLMYYDIAKDRV